MCNTWKHSKSLTFHRHNYTVAMFVWQIQNLETLNLEPWTYTCLNHAMLFASGRSATGLHWTITLLSICLSVSWRFNILWLYHKWSTSMVQRIVPFFPTLDSFGFLIVDFSCDLFNLENCSSAIDILNGSSMIRNEYLH